MSTLRFRVRVFLALQGAFVLGQATSLAISLSVSGTWGAVIWPW